MTRRRSIFNLLLRCVVFGGYKLFPKADDHVTPQLLRLKCAAYSTLNDSDEDPNVEAFIVEKMRDAGVPFTPVRIAPAALYLTAIVE